MGGLWHGTGPVGSWFPSLVLALACAASSAYAQAGQASRDAVYDDLIDQAIAEFRRGNYAEAYSAFGRAHARRPSARTLRGLGVSAFEARRYADAIVHLEAALADDRRALPADQRAEVSKALQSAREHVAVLEVVLTPSDAGIRVDGQPARRRGDSLWIDPGVHEIAVSAPGHRTLLRRLELSVGERMRLVLTLEASESAIADADAAAAPAGGNAASARAAPMTHSAEPSPLGADPGNRDSEARSSILPVALSVAGAAILAGAAVTGLMVRDAKRELLDNCVEGACEPSYRDEKERGESMRTLTNALLLSGGAVLATGAIWWLLDEPTPHLAAGCAPGGCAAELRGRF